jgi:hypothetical protein
VSPETRRILMHRGLYASLAAVSLAACLASGAVYFIGYVEAESYRKALAVASLAWFIFATAWSGQATGTLKKRRKHSPPPE